MAGPEIKYLAWLDFESTGLSFRDDEIVEAAVYMTDMQYEPIVIEGLPPTQMQAVLQCSPQGIQRIYNNPVVFEMHSENGLLNLLENNQGTNPMDFFYRMERMLMAIGKPGEFRLAGSGVERFDRHMLDKYWLTWADWFHYRCHDISSIRTWLQDAGLEWMIRPSSIDPSSHRAMPDVLRSIDEARHLNDWIVRAATLQKTPNKGASQ